MSCGIQLQDHSDFGRVPAEERGTSRGVAPLLLSLLAPRRRVSPVVILPVGGKMTPDRLCLSVKLVP